ncbi:cupin domain-containing protein [Myxacorys almedinensis]|uniref:Transcription negative regulator ChrR n=1 Tax=Myxacorys almedinensis A TaxID=2690445 RepID=A0A8J7Z247_9CYAN|nr:cupin domain-containing protein [Myxacorys almedinensis]NDJ16406.1 transcription negative regulator ChrR [Myxacorys almedinensis A]
MLHSLTFQQCLTIAHHQNDLPWQPFRPGVEIYRFYEDETGASAAALLRYQPGAQVPHHSHPGFEHILVLSGSQQDQRGSYETGTLVINPPDTQHSVTSKDGCIVLVIWEKPVIIHDPDSPSLPLAHEP